METIFMNTEISKTNESNKFIYQFSYKRNLKDPNKNIGLVISSIYYTWKTVKSACNCNKLKISASTWNDNILLQTFKIILSMLLKSMRLLQIIPLCKFIQIKSKTGSFLK